ncbi:MAG: hypothetical protein KJ667_07695, partial [Alphaproteobacteria bacterium]|nr:hypothetical protein [Alphaproteobacteria bacterium]
TQTQVAQQQALSDKQKAELVAAQAQLAELSAQQAQLERAKAEIATLSAQQDELTRAQQQIAQLTAERAQLEQARAQVAQLSNEKQQLLAETAKIAQLTAEKNALKAEAGKVAVLESEMGALAAAKAQAEADRAEMAKLAGERATLLQRVAALEADKDAMEKALSGMAPAAGGAPQIAAAIPTGGSRAVSSFAHAQEANVTAPSAIQTAAVEQQRIVPRDAVIKAEPLAPQMPRGPQAAAPMALAPAVEAATTGGTSLMDSNAVTRLLQQAGIQAQGGVQTEKTSAQMVSYSWDTGTVYGTAEQQPMGGMGQFETMVQAYLSKTGERCTGDFGAIPGMTEDRDGARVATYEIACIMPDGAGASAAIVFHAQDGLFTAIAHEAAMDGMDIAMDVRDAVFTSLLQTKLASR